MANHAGKSARHYQAAQLNEKQRRFVERYLVHGNGDKAAREAGYEYKHGIGAQVLKQRAVFDALQAARKQRSERNAMERSEALELLSAIARAEEGSPLARDQIEAVKTLMKMEGWEAPKKLEQSGPGGGPIPVSTVTRDEAVEALREEAARDPELAAELKRLGGGS